MRIVSFGQIRGRIRQVIENHCILCRCLCVSIVKGTRLSIEILQRALAFLFRTVCQGVSSKHGFHKALSFACFSFLLSVDV